MSVEGELTAVLGRPTGRYQVDALVHHAANSVTAGIWRYAGDGWSLVRKHLTPHGPRGSHWSGAGDLQHWNYWRREALAYETGLAGAAYAGSGIRAPELRGAYEQPDGSTVLWLEDVHGEPGEHWGVDRVIALARQLGRGQGRYLGATPPPDLPWLSRRWLRQYVGSKPVTGTLLRDDARWEQPRVRAAYAGLRPGLVRLWEEREWFFALVESLPQTLAHLDVWPKNVIAQGERSVLLDWSFVGLAALGEDAGNLVADSVWDGWLPTAALPELADGIWRGYLAGLREAGWTGDEAVARLGFTASAAVKYAWLAEWSLQQLAAGELTGYGGYSTRGADELLATYAAVFRVLLGWADEARALARLRCRA